MSASACGLRIKQSFGDLSGALCRAFTLTRHPLSIDGEMRPLVRRPRRQSELIPIAARGGSPTSQFVWPARHPAEMDMLFNHVRTRCHWPLYQDRRR